MNSVYKAVFRKNDVVFQEGFEISSQGAVKTIGKMGESWTWKHVNEVFMDHKLENIWAITKGARNISCFRAGGIDQPLTDLNIQKLFFSDEPILYLVRGLESGRSSCTIISRTKCIEIVFGINGYEVLPPFSFSELFSPIVGSFHPEYPPWNNAIPNLSQHKQWPLMTHFPLFLHEENYIVWDYVEGFTTVKATEKNKFNSEFISTNDYEKQLMERVIELPGGNEVKFLPTAWEGPYIFSSDLCRFHSSSYTNCTLLGFYPVQDSGSLQRFTNPQRISKNQEEEINQKENNMQEQYIVTKDILATNYEWLGRDFLKGELVSRFFGATYGCIGPNGIAIIEDDGLFSELPKDSLELI